MNVSTTARPMGTITARTSPTVTAAGLVEQALRAVHRNNPNMSGLVSAAADYDRNVQPEVGA